MHITAQIYVDVHSWPIIYVDVCSWPAAVTVNNHLQIKTIMNIGSRVS
jgi:hypothetical protein